MGFTSADHRQPDSNVICAAVDPASRTMSDRPCSKERVSTGLSNVLLANRSMHSPFSDCRESTTSAQRGQPSPRQQAGDLDELLVDLPADPRTECVEGLDGWTNLY